MQLVRSLKKCYVGDVFREAGELFTVPDEAVVDGRTLVLVPADAATAAQLEAASVAAREPRGPTRTSGGFEVR